MSQSFEFDSIDSNHRYQTRNICELIIFLVDSIQVSDELLEHGWCTRISTRLTCFNIADFDYIEREKKTIYAMISLVDICRMDFVLFLSSNIQLIAQDFYYSDSSFEGFSK